MHGVVDVYGSRKPSYELLRRESSPIESVTVERRENKLQVLVRVRRDFPSYRLTGYKVRAVLFGEGNIPVETHEVNLPDSAPGSETVVELAFSKFEAPLHAEINVLRRTSFSAFFIDWKP